MRLQLHASQQTGTVSAGEKLLLSTLHLQRKALPGTIGNPPPAFPCLHYRIPLSALPFDQAGTFPVMLTSVSRACPDTTFTDSIQVYPLPLADLGPDTALCLNGPAIRLYNAEQAVAGSRYTWSTGDTSATIQVKHPGTYRLSIVLAPWDAAMRMRSSCAKIATSTSRTRLPLMKTEQMITFSRGNCYPGM